MRSATSRTVAWLSMTARVAGSRTTRSARLDPHRQPAGAAHAVRDRDRRLRRSRAPEHGGDAGGVVGVHEVGERAAEQGLGLQPEQLAAGGRGVAHARRRARARRSGRWRSRRARASAPRPRSRASSARSRSARRIAISPSASRSRRSDCEPTTAIRIVSSPPTSSVASASPWRAAGCSTATRPHAVAEPDALAAAGGAGRATGSPPWATATRVPFGRCAATASRTRRGGEGGQERAGGAASRAARTGTATAMLGGEPSTAGRIWVARVSPERIAPCSAARPADCSTASRRRRCARRASARRRS